jgi:zinc transporter 2
MASKKDFKDDEHTPLYHRLEDLNEKIEVSIKEQASPILVENTASNEETLKKLWIVCGICLVFMIIEIIGGYLANSIAIMSDAAHLLSDFLGFIISIVSIYISRSRANHQMSFGYHRAEVIGALVSVTLIWGLTIWLLYEATLRMINPGQVNGLIMLITAVIGFVFNIVMGVILAYQGIDHNLHHHHDDEHGHSHGGSKQIVDHADHEEKSDKADNHGHSHSIDDDDDHGDHGHSHGEKKDKVDKVDNHGHSHSNDDHGDHVHSHGEKKEKLDNHGHSHSNNDADHGHSHSHDEKNETTLTTKTTKTKDHAPQEFKIKKKQQESHEEDSHGHSHDSQNVNLRAALIHVIGDAVQNLGVVIAGLIIFFYPTAAIADPICTYIFSIIVVFTTIRILKDCVSVLMEGSPIKFDMQKLENDLHDLNGVLEVHDLHVWSLSVGKLSLSCHITSTDPQTTLKEARKLIKNKYKITHSTIQVEDDSEEMSDCSHDLHHEISSKKRNSLN